MYPNQRDGGFQGCVRFDPDVCTSGHVIPDLESSIAGSGIFPKWSVRPDKILAIWIACLEVRDDLMMIYVRPGEARDAGIET